MLATDLGVIAKTYPILEQDLIEQIKLNGFCLRTVEEDVDAPEEEEDILAGGDKKGKKKKK